MERAKCIIFDAEVDNSYWAEACNHTAFIMNRSASSSLNGMTPEEMWTNKKVDVSDIKVFGSPVMVHIPKANRRKLDAKSVKLIFVDFDSDKKGIRCIDPKTRKLTVSRDVVFYERNDSSRILINFGDVREERTTATTPKNTLPTPTEQDRAKN